MEAKLSVILLIIVYISVDTLLAELLVSVGCLLGNIELFISLERSTRLHPSEYCFVSFLRLI